MRKFLARMLSLALIIIMITSPVLADAKVGEKIISIGADLTKEEKEKVLEELGDKDAKIIEVTNKEEHKYLGSFIPAEKIGNKALSSAKVMILEENKGITVSVSNNITYVTEDMYRNALITAGIKDAKVDVTALSKVTGTGALTGILKAYEILTGKIIPEEVKEIANEELVVTYQISEDIGKKDAADLINSIKVSFSENMPKNEEEARTIIVNVSNNYDIKLSDEQIDRLVSLFMKMKNSNIDWNKVADTAEKYSKQAAEYLSSDEGQSFLQSLKNGIVAFIDWIASLFK